MIREKIEALTTAMKNSSETSKNKDLQTIEDFIKDCAQYVESRTIHESARRIARFRMEAEEYRNYIQTLDKQRRLAHDAVTISIKLINRLAELYNEPAIYEGADDRYEMADFALLVVSEYYQAESQ